MIVCPGCSNESADDAVFCGFCGTKLKDDAPKKTLFAFAAIPAKDVAAPEPKPKAKPKPKPKPKAAEDDPELGKDTVADLSEAAKAALAAPADQGDTVDVDDGWGLDLDFGDTSTGMPAITGANQAVESKQADAKAPPSPVVTQQTPAVDPKEPASADAPAAVAADPAATAPGGRPGPGKPGIGEAVLRSGVGMASVDGPKVVAEDAEEKPARPKIKDDGKATTLLPRSSGNADVEAPASTGKEDEESFFGASLSKYGLAGIAKEELEASGYPAHTEQDVAAELKQANNRSVGMMLVAVFVFVILIGAIAALMIIG